jgi:hypothetical protein
VLAPLLIFVTTIIAVVACVMIALMPFEVWFGVALAAREFRNYATTNNLDPANYASQAVTALYWERVPVDPTILAYGRACGFHIEATGARLLRFRPDWRPRRGKNGGKQIR